MNRHANRGGVLARVAIAIILAACSTASSPASATTAPGPSSASSASPVEGAELSLLGAASLKDALAAIKAAYEQAVPGAKLTVATDASSTLRTQIEQGAPGDVFLSADQKNPSALVDAGLADGDVTDFAGNALVIIVPSDNPARLTGPIHLARPGLKVVAAGDDVPISGYARQVVTKLAGLPGYPADFAAAYAANVVSKEDNVKAVVTKIELGEGDAAIVYRTDALASSNVQAIELPDKASVSATYAGVVLKASKHLAAGHAFLEWLTGSEGAAILARFGFVAP